MKVQGTMGQQDELQNFFRLISDPMRIAVQRELFTNVLREKNETISETLKAIEQDKKGEEKLTEQMKANEETTEIGMQMNERLDSFLPSIVERLDTDLALPHVA